MSLVIAVVKSFLREIIAVYIPFKYTSRLVPAILVPTMLAVFSGSLVCAQTLDEDIALAFDEQFISIATGGQTDISRAPAIATVITADDIAKMGAQNLDQVLESVPGFHVSASSIRLTPIYSIRGIQSDVGPQVLMLINGVPITQMWQGDRGLLPTLPIADIARVEILRGPGSAVYGTDAFAGVINILTKSAATINGTHITATVGSFGTRSTSILHGKTYNDISVSFSAQYTGTDGDNGRIIEEDAQTYWDNLTGTSVSTAPGPLNTRSKRLDTRIGLTWNNLQLHVWNLQHTDLAAGPGLAQALDSSSKGDINNWLIDAQYHDVDFGKNIEVDTRISFMDIATSSAQTLFPRNATLPIGSDGNVNPITPAGLVTFTDGMIGNPEIYEQHTRADAALLWHGLDDQKWRFALGYFSASLQGKETKNFGPGVLNGTEGSVDGTLTDVTDTPFIFAPDQDRTVYYVSVQDEWYFAPDWDLTAGLRYDQYSDFKEVVTPRAALVWHPAYNISTKLLYGEAFRAPSFLELYAQNNPVKLGNPELKAETIKTLELAMDYQYSFTQRYTMSIFAYEIDDQIVYTTVDSNAPQANNVGRQEGRGFELEMFWAATKSFDLAANYAYHNAKDKTNNSDAPDSPQQQLYIKADWRILANWNVNLQANRVFQRSRSFNDTRSNIDGYTMVDLAIVGTEIARHWGATLRVSNIFNANAYEPSPAEVAPFIPGDYPLAGRAYTLTAHYRF
ncbi:MAG: TonB-dependent receptor [Ectothiorhodospiraceae bacterium]|nr:TonB-dependent receptor [Ectothiorhodospiraceae bacterium]